MLDSGLLGGGKIELFWKCVGSRRVGRSVELRMTGARSLAPVTQDLGCMYVKELDRASKVRSSDVSCPILLVGPGGRSYMHGGAC